MRRDFADRYGPWALVSGSAQGLGEAFARRLAAAGLDLILLDRQAGPLEALAGELRATGREVVPVHADLADEGFLDALEAASGEREIGLLVACAAYSTVAPFLERPVEDHLRTVDVNVRATLRLTERYGRRMVARGRGGVILLSSASALQGTALVASYAATKAWNLILAEALWAEWRPHGVDVLGFLPGATDTPAFRATGPMPERVRGMAVMSADTTAAEALEALGRTPSRIAGRSNRLAALFTNRLMSRRRAIGIYRDAMQRLYGRPAERVTENRTP